MTKWEYKIEQENGQNGQYGESWLNKFGAESWEIINVRPGHVGLEYTFKRPLVEDKTFVNNDGHQWVSWSQKIQPVHVAADDLIEWEYWKSGRFFQDGPVRADQVPWHEVSAYRVVRP